jgi:hypothetical protein
MGLRSPLIGVKDKDKDKDKDKELIFNSMSLFRMILN